MKTEIDNFIFFKNHFVFIFLFFLSKVNSWRINNCLRSTNFYPSTETVASVELALQDARNLLHNYDEIINNNLYSVIKKKLAYQKTLLAKFPQDSALVKEDLIKLIAPYKNFWAFTKFSETIKDPEGEALKDPDYFIDIIEKYIEQIILEHWNKASDYSNSLCRKVKILEVKHANATTFMNNLLKSGVSNFNQNHLINYCNNL